MTEAMPFLQKHDITFLRPPHIGPGDVFCMRTQVSALPCGRYGHVSKNLTRERI